MTSVERNITRDGFEIYTSDSTEFSGVLRDITIATSWKEIAPSAVSFYGFKPGDYEAAKAEEIKYTEKDLILSGMDEELVCDTLKGSRLFVDLGDGSNPMFLRDTAITSAFMRAGVECKPRLRKALSHSNPDAMAGLLNVGFSVNNGRPMKVCICGEKVNALLSPSYVILGNENVIEIAQEALAEKFGELEFISGKISHGIVIANYTMPDVQNEFVSKYKAAIEFTPGNYQVDTVIPAVTLKTSDCGMCSATLAPKLLVNGRMISFMKPMKTRHIGEEVPSVEAWEKTCASLYAKMDDTLDMVDKMAHTEVDYPLNLIQNLCKAVKIPDKWILFAKQAHKRLGEGMCSMLDVYYSLYEGIDQADEKKRISLEEKISRVLLLDWSDYDKSVCIQ